MSKPTDHPPLPYIPALDPAEFEQSWQDVQRLLAALNGARLGAWDWDIASGRVNWSRGAQALFGLDPKRPLRTQVDYIELIPEEDRAGVLELFARVLSGAHPERAFRHRIRWPDGSLHWLEISGSPQQDADGRKRIIGVIRDVTEQQERAEALENSQRRFSSLFHLSPDVVLLVRMEGSIITEANQHFESVFGWPAAEVVGRSTRAAVSQPQRLGRPHRPGSPVAHPRRARARRRAVQPVHRTGGRVLPHQHLPRHHRAQARRSRPAHQRGKILQGLPQHARCRGHHRPRDRLLHRGQPRLPAPVRLGRQRDDRPQLPGTGHLGACRAAPRDARGLRPPRHPGWPRSATARP